VVVGQDPLASLNFSSFLWLLWLITKADSGQSFRGVDDGDLFADSCGDRLKLFFMIFRLDPILGAG
jgi:hypothetical protein